MPKQAAIYVTEDVECATCGKRILMGQYCFATTPTDWGAPVHEQTHIHFPNCERPMLK
mgnify:FL=1